MTMIVDCPHGWEDENGDPMPCPKCLIAAIERLRDARTRMLRDAQCNGFIGEDEDEAISWAIRRSAELHRLQKAVAEAAAQVEIERLRAIVDIICRSAAYEGQVSQICTQDNPLPPPIHLWRIDLDGRLCSLREAAEKLVQFERRGE